MNRTLLFFIAFKLGLIMVSAFVVILVAPQYTHHLLLVIAGVLVLSGLGEIVVSQSQKPWLEYEGTLLGITGKKATLPEAGTPVRASAFTAVEFEYTVNDKCHRCTTLVHSHEDCRRRETDGSIDAADAAARWHPDMRAGDTVTVYVNPANASDAVLVNPAPAQRTSHPVALLLTGLLFGILWFVVHRVNDTP